MSFIRTTPPRAALALVLLPIALTALAATAATTPLPTLFSTSDQCQACHNGLHAADGSDVSIGMAWRPTMMANSARDPYWQAGVRREVLDHPESQAAIEAECSACHMPMARQTVVTTGGQGEVFANLPVGISTHPTALLAAEGVSCSACHQVQPPGLGDPSTYNGRFEIDRTTPAGQRDILGPVPAEPRLVRLMQSAMTFEPVQAPHVQQASFCASCHTLITHSLGPGGQVLGEFPEQVPYLEWQHSAFHDRMACQSCHMPVVEGEVPISSVLGQPRSQVSRHAFQGGNFFLTRIFTRYGAELGVTARVQDLERSHAGTVEHLQSEAARLTVSCDPSTPGILGAAVRVENLGGHKLPTAYPSRRTWLHLVVEDASGQVLLDSGRPSPDGSIVGNDNDADGSRYEPHHAVIRAGDQVQIWETILADPSGAITTGLLQATRYAKDNRILPAGFEKATAPAFVAVHGDASTDPDFVGGSDAVRYEVAGTGAYTVRADLHYQPVGYRWAHNLGEVKSAESERFTRYYEALASSSSVRLASARVTCAP